MSGDVRTPDRLVDGDNSNLDGHHTWLAPVLPGLDKIAKRECKVLVVLAPQPL